MLDVSEIMGIVHSHIRVLTNLVGKGVPYLTYKQTSLHTLKRLEEVGVLECINPDATVGIRLKFKLSETGITILGHALRNQKELEVINMRNMIDFHYDLLKFVQAGRRKTFRDGESKSLRRFVDMGILTYKRGRGYRFTAKGASEVKLHEFTYRKNVILFSNLSK